MVSAAAVDFAANKLFRGIPEADVQSLVDRLQVVEAPADEVVLEEDGPPTHLYLISEGSVRVSKRGRGGRQETLGFLGPGDFFGEMALLDEQPVSARVTAAQQCRLGRMDRAGLDLLFEAAPATTSRNLVREVVSRLRETDSHLIREMLEAERLSLVGSMVAGIVHDFKNPISTILNAAELLAEAPPTVDRSRYVDIIRRSVHQMTGMTAELLDYCRGVSRLDLQKVGVEALLTELDASVPGRSRTVEVARDLAYTGEVVIDRDRFLRLLQNLVKNAVEASQEGSIVTVRVERRDDDVVFCISDTGCGIPPDLVATIFEPFVTHGKSDGTGLGMAIVKSIVDAHGGSIRVDSTLGVGTRVEVALPAEQATRPD